VSAIEVDIFSFNVLSQEKVCASRYFYVLLCLISRHHVNQDWWYTFNTPSFQQSKSMNFDAWLIIESDNSIGQCPKENIRRKRMVQECHGHVKKVSMQVVEKKN